MKNRLKVNRLLSVIIIVSCSVVVALFFLSDWQWLASANYNLHEVLAFLINIGYFLIPAELIIGLICYIKYRKNRSRSFGNALLNFAAVAAFIVYLTTVSFYYGSGVTSGYEANVVKYESNGGFYVVLNGEIIEVSEHQYSLAAADRSCTYTYRHSRWMGKDYYRVDLLTSE